MAPAKNTRSQATTSKDSRARGNALADQSKNEDEKTNIEPVQSNDSKAKIEDWLGKVDDGVDSKDNSTTTKKRRAIKQSASTTVKTQKRLSTYVRVSKSTNKDGKGREEIQEIETGSAVKVTTVSPDRKVTRERHEIITDTTVITTRDADAGKKRKFGEDNDTDYVPSAPGPTVKGLAEAAEEDFGERATKRLRRKLRDSTSSYSHRRSDESSSDAEASSLHLSGEGAAHALPRKSRLAENDAKKKLILTLRIAGLGELNSGIDSIVKTEDLPVALPGPGRKRSLVQKPIGGWDNKEFSFKFGWTRYPNHVAPTHEEAADVFEILRADLATRDVVVGPGERGSGGQGPAHGSATGVTVDAMVRTLLSQATSNENALFVQDLLIQKYTYTVDGKEVRGLIPNYHTVHACSAADLEPVIQACGLQEKRAKFIKAYLETVYKTNTVDNPDWDGVHAGNSPGAPDFVPGLLSLEFLDGLKKVELFNWLLAVKGVGLKTAHCIMEFNYRLPICAVDTHVHFMAGALRWIPEECKTANDTAMHLDARLPDALKHDLHQAFWNHRQHCGPCKKADGNKVTGIDAARCILEDRVERRDTRAYRRGNKKEVIENVKVVRTSRKPSMKQFSAMTAEKAAELGYVYHELEKNDDFGAGSVNKTVKKMWKLVRE